MGHYTGMLVVVVEVVGAAAQKHVGYVVVY
jgi:hypothetical protein